MKKKLRLRQEKAARKKRAAKAQMAREKETARSQRSELCRPVLHLLAVCWAFI